MIKPTVVVVVVVVFVFASMAAVAATAARGALAFVVFSDVGTLPPPLMDASVATAVLVGIRARASSAVTKACATVMNACERIVDVVDADVVAVMTASSASSNPTTVGEDLRR